MGRALPAYSGKSPGGIRLISARVHPNAPSTTAITGSKLRGSAKEAATMRAVPSGEPQSTFESLFIAVAQAAPGPLQAEPLGIGRLAMGRAKPRSGLVAGPASSP